MTDPSPEDAQVLLSRNLGLWRKERGLLLKQMAPALGVSIAALDGWETGLRFPTGEHLTVISRYTGVPVWCLFCPRLGACPRDGGPFGVPTQ